MASAFDVPSRGHAHPHRHHRSSLQLVATPPRHAGPAPPCAHPPSPIDRRALLATLAAAPLTQSPSAEALPFFGSKRPELPPNVVQDDTLAYTFTYPLTTADGVSIPVTVSRKPEKYSSAAPLTADARQRIVSQYVSLSDGITMTVFVGPATGPLAATEPAQWRPKDVATAVLTDRSAVRSCIPACSPPGHPCLPSLTLLHGAVAGSCWVELLCGASRPF